MSKNVYVVHWDNGNIRKLRVENENEELHNESGPAVQYWHENGREKIREYWINGYFHNEDGPAVQYWYKNGQERRRQYWVDGEELSEEKFYNRKNKVKITVNDNEVRYISKESAEELNLI